MKISSIGSGTRENISIRDSSDLVKITKAETGFRSRLSQAYRGDWDDHLTGLLKDIDGAANRLNQEKTIPALKSYKEKIRNFVRIVTERAYELKEGYSWNNRGGQRVFVLVRKIDEHLEKLTEGVLDEQKEGIDLLERLDEIRGILVDLFV
jgi:uncharacterized protein YaaR (DUF327 family)